MMDLVKEIFSYTRCMGDFLPCPKSHRFHIYRERINYKEGCRDSNRGIIHYSGRIRTFDGGYAICDH